MDNSVYHPSLMISVPKEHLVNVLSSARDLLKDLNNETKDIYEQVAACCNRHRPLCRDIHCSKPCISGDPWDHQLVPRLDECEEIDHWLQAHGIEHRHPFYRNFCYEHINSYIRSNGKWVAMPEIPILRRSVVRRVVPDEQEGPIFYCSDDESTQFLEELIEGVSGPMSSTPRECPVPDQREGYHSF
jgi:hypothetical protein